MGDGASTVRQHLESVARQTGRPIVSPDLPLEAAHIWDWWREVSLTRSSNGFAPNMITFAEIAHWSRLTGTQIRPPEVRLVMILDQVWMEAWAESSKRRQRFREQQAEAARRQRGR